MDIFKTTSGKEYNCPLLAEAPIFGKLYVAVSDLNFAEAAALFSNKAEMQQIEYADNTLTGFTHLDYIMQEQYGIKACLSKEST